MKVTLYSTGCPQCIMLERILKTNSIEFEIVNDVELMKSKGFTAVPMTEIDGIVRNYSETFKWINERRTV